MNGFRTRMIGILVVLAALLLLAVFWRFAESVRSSKMSKKAAVNVPRISSTIVPQATTTSSTTGDHAGERIFAHDSQPARFAPPTQGTRAADPSMAGLLTSATPAALPTVSPGLVASETEMVYLIFHLEGQSLSVLTQSVTKGNMRLPPAINSIAPMRSIYHRVLSASGAILAQDTMPDPSVLHYDYPGPVGAGELQGGTIIQTQVDFNVRYPLIEGMDRIELYHTEATTDLTRLSRESKEYYGSFKLETTSH